MHAQSETQPETQDPAGAWLDDAGEVDPAELRRRLAARSPEQLALYFGQLLEKLGGNPPALDTRTRLAVFDAHRDALQRVDAGPAAWVCVYFARYLLLGGSGDGALAALDLAEPGAPPELRPFVVSLRLDALFQQERAIEACRVAAAARAATEHPIEQARLLSQEAAAHTMLGRLDRAWTLIGAADARLDAIGDEQVDALALGQTRFDVQLRRLDVLLARERDDRARRSIEALRATRQQQGPPLQPHEQAALAVYTATCDYLEAQRHPQRVGAVLERLAQLQHDEALQPRDRRLLRCFVIDLHTAAAQLDEAHAALRELEQELGDLHGATRSLRWRLAPIAARLARLRGEAGEDAVQATRLEFLQQTCDEMLDEWRRAPLDGDRTGFLRLGSRMRVVGELVAGYAARSQVARALDVVLSAQRCTTLARRAGVDAPTTAQLQALLARERAVAWLIVPSWYESHTIVVDGERIRIATAPRASQLRESSARLTAELAGIASASAATAADLARLRTASADTAAALVPEALAEQLSRTPLVYATGAGLIGGLPLSALRMPDGRLLGEAAALCSTSSLPLLVHRATERAKPPSDALPRALVCATLTPGPAFAARNGLATTPPTGTTRDIWHELTAALGDGSVQLLDGNATVPALRAHLHEPFDLAVLIAHGEGAHGEEPAALGLTPTSDSDGELTAEMLTNLPIASTVVLGACRAAQGPRRIGDDDTGGALVGACLAAGSEAVVASRSPQHLSLYRRIAATFTRQVDAGVPVAEALRRARRDAAADPADAFAAAQIELFGDGALRLAAPRPTRWIALVAAALAAIVALVAAARWISCRRYRSKNCAG